MLSFDECIHRIDSQISIQKKDREVFTKDFDFIRDHVMDIMKASDPVFKKIFGGQHLFGSWLDNIKLDVPDEFDVHFMLSLPFYRYIELNLDLLRPGFVKLNISKPLQYMEGDINLNEVYQLFTGFIDDKGFLLRNKVQRWLENVIRNALKIYGTYVTANGTEYDLVYLKRGTAHTFMACSGNRVISIDFVPAFRFNADYDWFAQRPFPKHIEHKLWFAVPKPSAGPKHGRKFSFSICAPQVEKYLLTKKNNLKPTLRLLKSLRDRMDRHQKHLMKSYFIKSLFLFENEKHNRLFWMRPPGELLLYMLDKLLMYLNEKCIPFYWSPSMNLLENLDSSQIAILKRYFSKARNRLESFSTQKEIKYGDIRNLFGKSSYRL